MRIQIRVGEGEARLINLLNRLKEEGEGIRDYKNDKLKEMITGFDELCELIGEYDPGKALFMLKSIINAYKTLADYTGETDPFKVIMKLSAKADGPSETAATKEQPEEPPKPKKKKVKSKKLLASLDNM
jgi:hypothetical protein